MTRSAKFIVDWIKAIMYQINKGYYYKLVLMRNVFNKYVVLNYVVVSNTC